MSKTVHTTSKQFENLVFPHNDDDFSHLHITPEWEEKLDGIEIRFYQGVFGSILMAVEKFGRIDGVAYNNYYLKCVYSGLFSENYTVRYVELEEYSPDFMERIRVTSEDEITRDEFLVVTRGAQSGKIPVARKLAGFESIDCFYYAVDEKSSEITNKFVSDLVNYVIKNGICEAEF